MQEITIFCKRCKKSLRISYVVTGNDEAPVLPSVIIKCPHCKRALTLKKCTEKKFIANSVDGKYYL